MNDFEMKTTASPGRLGRDRGATLPLVWMFVALCIGPLRAADPPRAAQGSDPARLARIGAAQMPRFDEPVMFHTPQADAIVSALEIFPPHHALNQLVTDWPVHSLRVTIRNTRRVA